MEYTVSMESKKKPAARRPRRKFSAEFREGAIRLVLDEGKSIAEVARDLDLTHSGLSEWIKRAKADRGIGRPGVLTTAEKEELARLRKENRELRIEREILKKAAAFFAREESK
jgi:transposase